MRSSTATGRAASPGRVKAIYHPVYRLMIQRLVAARKKRGLTQEQVARVFHVHRQWVSKIETYEVVIDVISLLRLCRMYRIRPADLVRWMERRLLRAGAFFSLLGRTLVGGGFGKRSWEIQTCSILRSRRARTEDYPMGWLRELILAPMVGPMA
jgi:transcriptional regulator with XRE-family HTH domain